MTFFPVVLFRYWARSPSISDLPAPVASWMRVLWWVWEEQTSRNMAASCAGLGTTPSSEASGRTASTNAQNPASSETSSLNVLNSWKTLRRSSLSYFHYNSCKFLASCSYCASFALNCSLCSAFCFWFASSFNYVSNYLSIFSLFSSSFSDWNISLSLSPISISSRSAAISSADAFIGKVRAINLTAS